MGHLERQAAAPFKGHDRPSGNSQISFERERQRVFRAEVKDVETGLLVAEVGD